MIHRIVRKRNPYLARFSEHKRLSCLDMLILECFRKIFFFNFTYGARYSQTHDSPRMYNLAIRRGESLRTCAAFSRSAHAFTPERENMPPACQSLVLMIYVALNTGLLSLQSLREPFHCIYLLIYKASPITFTLIRVPACKPCR